MRPRTLDEMVGQRRLLAPGSALRRSVESGRVHSMVLWGPPGCGKTTLALLLAKYADAEFKAISAVLSGLPEVRRSEEHTSELQSLMRISYAVFCLKTQNHHHPKQ